MTLTSAEDGEAIRELRERTEASPALNRLEEVLSAAEMSDELLDIVAQRLAPPLNADSWGGVYDAFATFLGSASDTSMVEAPDLLVLCAPGGETQVVLEDALTERPRTAEFMRRAVARYGAAIQHAYGIWKERPDDWRVIQPRVWTELPADPSGSPVSVINLDIEKNNGERLRLQGSGDSVLALISVLLRALERLPDRGELDPRRVLEFADEAAPLVEYGHALSEPADRGPGSA